MSHGQRIFNNNGYNYNNNYQLAYATPILPGGGGLPSGTSTKDLVADVWGTALQKEIQDQGFWGWASNTARRLLGQKPVMTAKQAERASGELEAAMKLRNVSAYQKAVPGGGNPGPFSGLPQALSQLVPQLLGGPQPAYGATPTSRFPTRSGSTTNCSWDTKGGWCWKGIACGGSCRICRTGYATSNVNTGCYAVRSYFLNNYRKCNSCASKSGTGAPVPPKTSTGCPYSGCTSLLRGSSCFYCRCQKLCQGKGGVRTVRSDGSCYCKGSSSNIPTSPAAGQSRLDAGCSYSGCNEFHGMTRCTCRCRKKCGSRGVKTVTSNGSCYCKAASSPTPTTSSSGQSRLTAGCSYSGCNGFTGMTRCTCRCRKICASKGGVRTVTSNGSCYCN